MATARRKRSIRAPRRELSAVPRSAEARLDAAERLFRDFCELTPFRYRPFVRSFDSWTTTSAGAVPRRTPGTDNRALRVCRLMNAHRVRYLAAGGVAANLHGSVRATKYVDVLVPVNRANMERLLEALSALPWRVASELDPDEMLRKPITIVGDDPRVDVLTLARSH
jgi:hypothetical protein